MLLLKRGAFVVLFLLVITTFVSGFEVKTYNADFNLILLQEGSSWQTIADSGSIDFFINTSDFSEDSTVRICEYSSDCTGNNLYNSSLISKNIETLIVSNNFFTGDYLQFDVRINGVVSGRYRVKKVAVGGCTKISCDSGCTENGIIQYAVSYVCEESDSCEDHIVDTVDYSSCPLVNQINCSDYGAYEPTNLLSCENYDKFSLLTPCGETSTDYVYFDGNEYFQNINNICQENLEFVCEGKELYEITTTGNFDDDSCECESTKVLKETCLEEKLCDAQQGVCKSSEVTSSQLTIVNIPDRIVVGESITMTSNKNISWKILNLNEEIINENFVLKLQTITVKNLSVGSYKVLVDNQVRYFSVVNCESNDDCEVGLCKNPGLLNSECVVKECETDEDCIKEEGYDFKCNNALSIDSYCTYKNYTCINDDDCIEQVPADAKGVKCLNPKTEIASCSYANCPVECESNTDCNDNNTNTYDKCFLPATCQSECINKKYINLIEPLQRNYFQIPYLNFEIYQNEICTINLNEKVETVGMLPMKLTNTIQGNNSLVIDCESVSLNTWFLFNVEEEKDTEKNNSIERLREVLTKEKLLQIQKESDKLKDVIDVKNTIVETADGSQINTSLDIKENITDLEVYLEIPKCMAESVYDMEFDNEEFEILIEDPLIMWHFDEVMSQEDLIYRIKKKVSKECFDQLKVVTSSTDETDSNWWLYVALIPLILFVYSYFSQFAVDPSEDEEEDHDISAVDNYVKLLKKRIEKLEDEFSENKIRQILQEEGISEHLIDKAFR